MASRRTQCKVKSFGRNISSHRARGSYEMLPVSQGRKFKQDYVGLVTARPSNDNSNFLIVELPVVIRRQFFLDHEAYLAKLLLKTDRETKAGRTARFMRLMDENGRTRAE